MLIQTKIPIFLAHLYKCTKIISIAKFSCKMRGFWIIDQKMVFLFILINSTAMQNIWRCRMLLEPQITFNQCWFISRRYNDLALSSVVEDVKVIDGILADRTKYMLSHIQKLDNCRYSWRQVYSCEAIYLLCCLRDLLNYGGLSLEWC